MTSAIKCMHLFCKVSLFPGSAGFYLQAVQALMGLALSGLLHRTRHLFLSSWHCLALCIYHRMCSFTQPHRLDSFSGLQCWVLSAAALRAAYVFCVPPHPHCVHVMVPFSFLCFNLDWVEVFVCTILVALSRLNLGSRSLISELDFPDPEYYIFIWVSATKL